MQHEIRRLIGRDMTRRGRWALCAALACATLTCGVARGEFIVKDGKANAQIVIAAQAPRAVPLAAAQLQEYIAKISGVELAITQEPDPAMPVKLYVGRSTHTDRLGITDVGLRYGAFRMISGPDYLALIGYDNDAKPKETYIGSEGGRRKNYDEWDKLTGGMFGNPVGNIFIKPSLNLSDADDRGSLNAVYEFLGTLGVRWYFPGEIGEVCPKTTSIALPDIDRTVRPDFRLRNFFIYYKDFRRGEDPYILWQLRMGLWGGADLIGGSGYGHGLGHVHGRDKRNPEWFALFDGQRAMDGRGHPCLSSEGLFEATLQYARAVFRIYPDQRMIDLGPVDGYGNLCQCEGCRDRGTFERGWKGRMSDYVWGFINRVATELYKTHPDRIVHCIAYSGYQLPPEKIDELSPNVAITICRWRSNFIEPETKDMFRNLTEDWLEKLPSGELYIWDYYLHPRYEGAWDGVPVYTPHIIADDLQFLKGKSWGDFIEIAEYWPAWNVEREAMAANHLNVYVTSRLYWDADQDVDALLEEYYRNFYGPAAEPMKRFVQYAEANWRTANKDPNVIDELDTLLTDARQAAGDGVYARRIDIVVDYMQPLRDKRDTLAQGRKNVPVAVAPVRDEATLTMDGKLDDLFWKGVEAYPLLDLVSSNAPAQPGYVKAAWAGDSLYLAIVCKDSEMKTLNIGADEDENTNIFNGDNVELLLETQTHSYYQMAISPTGALVDLDRNKGLNTLWSSQAQVAAHRDDDAWTLEIRLPAAGNDQAALDANNGIAGSRPTQGNPWYINVCRQRLRGQQRDLSAFSPTGKASFHDLLKFGKLYVE